MILLLSALLASSPVFAKSTPKTAAPAPQEQNLLNEARRETSIEGVKTSKASDAQLTDSGLLYLKDPGLTAIASKWSWLLGIRAQKFAPQGQPTMGNGQAFSLDTVGSGYLPIVDFGLQRELLSTQDVTWKLGLRAEGGYNSQQTSVVFPTGVRPDSSRLTTSFVGGLITGSAQLKAHPQWEFEGGLGAGVVNYTQSSSNDSANFAVQGSYRTLLVGLVYNLSKNWALSLEEENRSLSSSSSDIKLQADNLSLGTRILW